MCNLTKKDWRDNHFKQGAIVANNRKEQKGHCVTTKTQKVTQALLRLNSSHPHSAAPHLTVGHHSISPSPFGTVQRLIGRSEEHTSELQSQSNLLCRPLL